MEMNVDSVIIPGGSTKYIQAPDVCQNKPFKPKCVISGLVKVSINLLKVEI